MRHPLFLLPTGLLAGVLAFAAAYWFQTRESRSLGRSPEADLAWLRLEFRLTDEQFARITRLHEAYRPRCAEFCREIEERNRAFERAVMSQSSVGPELERLVVETGRARDDCRRAMLGHLYAVAAEMSPEEGRRYLALMLRATSVLDESRPRSASHDHGHGHDMP